MIRIKYFIKLIGKANDLLRFAGVIQRTLSYFTAEFEREFPDSQTAAR